MMWSAHVNRHLSRLVRQVNARSQGDSNLVPRPATSAVPPVLARADDTDYTFLSLRAYPLALIPDLDGETTAVREKSLKYPERPWCYGLNLLLAARACSAGRGTGRVIIAGREPGGRRREGGQPCARTWSWSLVSGLGRGAGGQPCYPVAVPRKLQPASGGDGCCR
jgi:hypothetical protein